MDFLPTFTGLRGQEGADRSNMQVLAHGNQRGHGATDNSNPQDGVTVLPEPGFVVKTVDDAGHKVFINLCGSSKIPAPGGWQHGQVPLSVKEALAAAAADAGGAHGDDMGNDLEALRFPLAFGPARVEADRQGEACMVFDCLLNADVVAQAALLRPLKLFLVELALGWAEAKGGTKLDRRYRLPRMRYKGAAPVPQTVRLERPPLVTELADAPAAEPAFPLITRRRADKVHAHPAAAASFASTSLRRMASFGVLAVLACLAAAISVHATDIGLVPGLPVSGNIYVQHVTSSLTSGAGGTVPGGGSRRLLDFTSRSLLQAANASTAAGEAALTAAAFNSVLAGPSGRKLLQTPNGLQITYAAVVSHSGRATVLLEFPGTAGNVAILTAATTQQPAGAISPPATFFNAEVAMGSTVAVSKTGFLAVSGGIVRVRLTFDLAGINTLPPLQFSWQYASNLPAPQPAFFFLNADTVFVDVDKAGLPTLKGLIDTLQEFVTSTRMAEFVDLTSDTDTPSKPAAAAACDGAGAAPSIGSPAASSPLVLRPLYASDSEHDQKARSVKASPDGSDRFCNHAASPSSAGCAADAPAELEAGPDPEAGGSPASGSGAAAGSEPGLGLDSGRQADGAASGGEGAPRKRARARAPAASAEQRVAERERQKAEKKAERERVRHENAERKAREKEEEKARKAREREQRKRDSGRGALEEITPIISQLNHASMLAAAAALHAEGITFAPDAAGGAALTHLPGRRVVAWQRRRPRLDGAGDEPPEDVPYVLVHLMGEDFVEEVERDQLRSLVAACGAAHPGYTLGLLIEGLDAHLRRQEAADYRARGPGSGGFCRAPIDAASAGLSVSWPGVRHALVPDGAAAAEHVLGLTKALAVQPYKVQDAFLAQFGSGKASGAEARDTLLRAPLPAEQKSWYAALCCLPELGPKQAHAVVGAWPSLGALLAAYQDPARSQREKEGLVAGLMRTGASMRIGPVASRKLFAFLTATDPLQEMGDFENLT
ncbi:hypothetical protein WJX81_006839 [Elliptochloris bilobata]|uniref:PIH1 N-terminal domain-containing protein n=1 Tax=Elliptochloris bilobata TaxID=381761 RepID=A0AAW1R4S6_9CHLO